MTTKESEEGASADLLRTNRDFRHLLGGAAFEGFAGQVGGFVIPVMAVSALAATEWDMGLLNAAESVAFLVIGLPAGAWVDRMRKRRLLVSADLVRALVLVGLVAAFAAGVASVPLLIGAALVMSVTNVFFDVSHQSFVPAITGRERVGEGNARLETVNSVSYIAGPGLGGVLLQWLGASGALVATALGFATSAGLLGRIRHGEELPPAETRRPLREEIAEGLAWVVRQPLLRRIVMCTGISNLFHAVSAAVQVIFLLRVLGLTEATVGVLFSLGSVGALVGATFANRVAAWVGEGRVVVVSALGCAVGALGTPLALLGAPVAWLVAGGFLFSFWVVVYNVAQVSFRQRICPPALLGRMNASVRFIVWGTVPIGGLLGGWLGTRLGVVPTLWIATVGAFLAVLPVALSPLLTMRKLPDA